MYGAICEGHIFMLFDISYPQPKRGRIYLHSCYFLFFYHADKAYIRHLILILI